MREKTERLALIGAAVLLLLLPPVTSRAHELAIDGDEEAAKALFQAAQGAYAQGRFNEALINFGMAYRAWPHPAFLFNIGQCHRQIGDHAAAVFFFRAYLKGMPEAPNRDAVDGLIDESLAVLREAGEDDDYDVPPELASLISGRDEARPEQATGGASPPMEAVTPPPDTTVDDAPLYTRWWLWTAVAVVVAGGAAGIGLAGREAPVPERSLSPIDLR